MSDVLVLVEHAEGSMKKVTGELPAAASRLGTPVAVVVGAPGTTAALAAAAASGDPVAVLLAATSVDPATSVTVAQWLPEEPGDRPEPGGAEVVVSGGRGVGSAEKF